jgi:hypothetical protein
MMTMMLALALAAAGPGEERRFGDWVVTCDNVSRCEASSLLPEGTDEPENARAARDAGPAGAMTLSFETNARANGVIGIWIDQRQMGSGVLRDGAVTLTGEAAEGMARAMAGGKLLTLRSGRRVMSRYSLAGSSAMLRYIDAEQGRAGGVTALVAKGPKSAAAVPPARPLPRVTATRPFKGKPVLLDAAALRALAAEGDCAADTPVKPGFFRLDARATLVMVPCRLGNRDETHLAFVLRDGKAVAARFDFAPARTDGVPFDPPGKPRTIANYDWSGGTLSEQPHPRGPGACGTAQDWVWDGTQFRMIRTYRLGVCDRLGVWLTAYRAEPVWR